MADKTFNIKTNIDLNTKEFNKGVASVQSNVGKLVKGVEGTTASVGEMRKALQQLKNISFAGKSIEEINSINKRIGELTDQMGDLKAMQKAMGSEFGSVMAGGLQTLSAAGEVIVGVASAFGASKEQAEKYQKAMVQLIGVTQALGVIEDALGTKQFQMIALKIKDTAATVQQTIATRLATIQIGAYNAAMLVNPAVLVLTAITGLVIAIMALTGAFKQHQPVLDKNSESYQKLIGLQNELKESTDELSLSNEDKYNKWLVSQGRMTEKEYQVLKISNDKKRRLEEVNQEYMEQLRAAQLNFEKTDGYTYEMLLADKNKALADSNKKRVEIIKDAWFEEQLMLENLTKSTIKLTKAKEDLNKTYNLPNAFDPPEYNYNYGVGLGLPNKIPISSPDMVTRSNFSNIFNENVLNEQSLYAENLANSLNIATTAMMGLSDAFVEMGETGKLSLKSLVLTTLAGIRQIVVARLAEAIMGQTAANSKFGLPGLIMAAAGITGVMAIFNSIPKFAQGGVVGGNSFTGDNVPAFVNSGEMIINKSQQANLFSMANGNIGSYGVGHVLFEIEGDRLVGVLERYNRRINKIR